MDVADVKQDHLQHARELGRWVGLRGLITLAFGILFLARPGTGVGVLVAVFAVYCFADGITSMIAAITGAAMRSRAALAIESVLSVLAGVITLAMPGNVAVVILYIISIRALVVGALEVIAAIRFGHAIPSPWMVALTGLLSIVFGILLVRNPAAGLLSIAWLVGLYGVVLGCAQLAAAFALRRVAKEATPLRPTPASA